MPPDVYSDDLRWRTALIPVKYRGLGLPPNAEDSVHLFVKEWPIRHVPVDTPDDALPQDRNKVGRGLLLMGNPGTGKTTRACSVLTEVARTYREHKRPSVLFVAFADYIDALHEKRSMFEAMTKARSEQAEERYWEIDRLLQRVRNSSLVVLDDVGKEHHTASHYAADVFEVLVRSRHRRGLPTIITTNLPGDAWDAMYNPSMRSFLTEAYDRVSLAGADHRRAM